MVVSEPSEGSEEEGRLATTSPYARPATHSQAGTKAPLQGAASYGQGQPPREADVACRVSSPQRRSASLAGAATRRGGDCEHTRLQRGARKRGWLQGACKGRPQGWPPLGRVAAGGQGQPSPTQGQQQR
ncbi:hypothetical protein GW17_00041298 [Ensete ventricosum]|nr:hypothetical protein GW17_00041298 [Ensete ventricosum]RZS11736.1 hypothetical protein BHM03_00043101 [Ensete ventricosum]